MIHHKRKRNRKSASRPPGLLLVLCALATASGLPGQEDPPAKPQPGPFIQVDEVVAIVNDRVITRREVEAMLPLASPDLWRSPARLLEERQRILRQLATFLILEQGIYSLPHEPDQIDQGVEAMVREEFDRRMKDAGSTQAFLEDLRDLGRTFEEERESLRSQIRWQLFMNERHYQRFSGRRGLLRIRPAQMLEIYGSQIFQDRRTLPAYAVLEVYELGPQSQAVAKQLRDRLERLGSDRDTEAPLDGIRLTRMLVVDCPEGALGSAVLGLGLRDLPPDQLLLGRLGLADPKVGDEAFEEGSVPRVGPIREIPNGLRVIRVLEAQPQHTLPFTDPRIQKEVRELARNLEQRAAEEELIRTLWESARIWPPDLKRLGPLGGSQR